MDDTTISMPLVAKEDCMNALIKPVNMIDNSTAVSFQKNPIIMTTNSTPTNVNSNANTQQQYNTTAMATNLLQQHQPTIEQEQQQQYHNLNQQQQPQHNQLQQLQHQHNQLPLQPANFVGNNLKNGSLNYG